MFDEMQESIEFERQQQKGGFYPPSHPHHPIYPPTPHYPGYHPPVPYKPGNPYHHHHHHHGYYPYGKYYGWGYLPPYATTFPMVTYPYPHLYGRDFFEY